MVQEEVKRSEEAKESEHTRIGLLWKARAKAPKDHGLWKDLEGSQGGLPLEE